MDNQFTPSTEDTSEQQPVAQPEQTQEPVTTPQVVQPAKQKKSKKKLAWSLLVVLLLAATAGGVYYWQHQQVQGLQKDKTALSKELSTAKLQLEQQKLTAKQLVDVADKAQDAAKTASATSSNLLPGEVSKKTTTSVTLAALRKPAATISAVWIEYGTDPTNLSKSTEKLTKELGLGAPNTFVASEFNVTQLTSGAQYYYRVAATESGKTIYSGVAGFTVLK